MAVVKANGRGAKGLPVEGAVGDRRERKRKVDAGLVVDVEKGAEKRVSRCGGRSCGGGFAVLGVSPARTGG